MNDKLEELKKKVQRLEKENKDREEILKLQARAKELEEAGTWKAKAKQGLKKLHRHLQEKGKKFRDEKEEQGIFGKPDYTKGISTNNDLLKGDFRSPITDEIMNKKRKGGKTK